MKFWKRIFLYSVILFIVLFNGAGIILIEKIHANSLDNAITSTFDQYLNVTSILYLNSDSLDEDNDDKMQSVKDWLEITINEYQISDNIEKPNIEIYSKDNEIIMSNSDITVGGERTEILEAKQDEKSFIIRRGNGNGNRYLFVSSIIKLHNVDYKLVVSKDINYVYTERISNYKFFIVLDIVIFIILAGCMYIISRKLTKSIVDLSEISKGIARGDYSKRVAESDNKDEIGVLARNFNIMIDVIEANILQLKDVNDLKQRFIDSLSHEIKTPITSIIGYSDLLLKGKVNEDIKLKALNYINSEAKRLENLNGTLLKLILIREEKVFKEKVCIRECILNACESLRYNINSNNINISIDLQETKIYADKQLIIVLLINIIENAIKAGDKNKLIELYDENKKNGDYVLKIKDYGIGIPKKDLINILEPFYMVDKARSKKNKGIGLGLSICSEICDMHDIKLNIDSKLNSGTEVTIIFSKEQLIYEK